MKAPARISHYALEERIGAGGMGEVYRARDLALGRVVALKVLGDDDGSLRARLLWEAVASARLQHPAIATFYEAGEDAGTAFIAMEYVRGETLRARLRRGPLPTDEALAVTACLLEALAHAHFAGILHRDIKPENVMVTGPHAAKLLDFGLAMHLHTIDDAAGNTNTALTGAGVIVGSVGYMSPEQVRGKLVDARSDVFAVATVLYEMLSGRAAFPGANATERLAALLSTDPVPLVGPSLPSGLWPLLSQALAREPARRPASARAFLADLGRVASGEFAAALPDTLAVLDLENRTGHAEDDWIGSGVAESLATDLARLAGFTVIAREKVLKARAALPAADPLEIGVSLGCRFVLAGSFQKMGPTLRITTRLLEAATGRVVASEKIDAPVDQIFDVQDRLAASCVAAMNLTVPTADTAAVVPPAPKLSAYEAYARGRRLWLRLEKGSFDEAAELYREAVALSPSYAEPLAGLAGLHSMRYTFTTDPRELATAIDYAQRSIAADATLGQPHVWLGYALMRQGRVDEAYEQELVAARLSPFDHFAPYFAGCSQLMARKPAAAQAHLQKAVELEPTAGFNLLGLGWAHLMLGQLDEARWTIQRAIALEGRSHVSATAGAAVYLGELERRAGKLSAAREACVAGIQAAEDSDHMYRDTTRAFGLCALGRTALDQADTAAAHAAFSQAVSHLRGRPRALGGGHLVVQALAGLARCGDGVRAFEEAQALAVDRAGFDFSWTFGCSWGITAAELARSAASLGRVDAERRWRAAEDRG